MNAQHRLNRLLVVAAHVTAISAVSALLMGGCAGQAGAIHADWFATGLWRREKRLSWAFRHDEFTVPDGVMTRSKLEKAAEAQSQIARFATVPSENELVKI